jgi:serine phosphatase RsbU (regulator of sigma subunit)
MLARVSILVIAAVLFATAIKTFYDYASSPTDENVFADAPPHLAIVPQSSGFVLKPAFAGSSAQGGSLDALRRGDLLLTVGKTRIGRTEDVRTVLATVASDSVLLCQVFRPESRTMYEALLPRKAFADSFVTQLPAGAQVISVAEEGASDRAGMKVGDLIIRINGQSFATADEADRLLRRGESGRTSTYDIIRNLEPMRLYVTLARFGFPLALFIFSFSGILYISVGTFIGWKGGADRGGFLTGLSYQLIGYVLAVAVVRRSVVVDLFVMFQYFLFTVSVFFGFVTAWHSSLLFPDPHTELLKKRRWIGAMYIGAGIASAVMLFQAAQTSEVNLGLPLVLFSSIGVAGGMLRLTHRKYTTPEFKRRRRFIKYTSVAVTLLNTALATFLAMSGSVAQIGFVGLVLLAIPFATLYTIGRYRLLGMELRVRRTFLYTLSSVLWVVIIVNLTIVVMAFVSGLPITVPVISVHGTSIEIQNQPEIGAAKNLTERMALVGIGLAAFWGVTRVRRGGQGLIDKYFDRTSYDYRRALEDFGSMLGNNLAMSALGKGIAEKIVDLMKINRAWVYFFREDGVCCCSEQAGLAEHAGPVPVDVNVVWAFLRNASSPVMVSAIPDELRTLFEGMGVRYMLPVRSKERLVAVIALGEKRSEASYNNLDFEFLTAVGKQASVAIENTFLYEELAGQERMKMELGIARRIQLASLPQQMPDVPGFELSGSSQPAMEVGGDFFDFLRSPDGRLTAIIGDVSGKGTSAALYMAKVQGIFRSLHSVGGSLRELFVRSNALLRGDISKSSFVTVLGVEFDPERNLARVIRAGNLPLYVKSADTGFVARIIPKGLALGMDDGARFTVELEEQTLSVRTGDVCLLVSDGITEARNTLGEEYGEDRLVAAFLQAPHLAADKIRAGILNDVQQFIGSAMPHDDQTIVVVVIR